MSDVVVDEILGDVLKHQHTAGDVDAPGSNTQVLYNDGGALAGATILQYIKASGNLLMDSDTARLVFGDGQDAELGWDNANSLFDISTGLSTGGSASGQGTIDKGIVVNEGGGGGADDDFRAETDNEANAFVVDASADEILGKVALKWGDDTNYTEIKTDGEINLHGTARVTKCHWIGANGIKAPGAKPATFVEDGLTGCWEFADAIEANQESVSGTVKIPEDMDRTVVPAFGIGWHADGISPGNCKWQFEYLWISPNEDVTVAAQETLTVTSTASATSNGLIVAEITGIDLPSGTDVAMFWKITRLSGDVADTISAVTHMRGNYFKYTSDRLGIAT